MLKEVGLLVNCGRWRFVREPKRDYIAVNFVASIEVLESHSEDTIAELREAIQETVTSWNRTQWRKMKKQEKDKKGVKHECPR